MAKQHRPQETSLTAILRRQLNDYTISTPEGELLAKEAVSRKLIQLAVAGNPTILKYVNDRIDGRPAIYQHIVNDEIPRVVVVDESAATNADVQSLVNKQEEIEEVDFSEMQEAAEKIPEGYNSDVDIWREDDERSIILQITIDVIGTIELRIPRNTSKHKRMDMTDTPSIVNDGTPEEDEES